MNIEQHMAAATRIERSLQKCTVQDWEMKIEGAMLAGTHWLNATLHRMGVTQPAADVFHSYLLTVNEYRRLCVAADETVRALSEIEDLRPPFVRGNWQGAQAAADRALALLSAIRVKVTQAG
ncbi:hypothetical protein LMG28688_06758 [Paraburkholderia caffeinitolerans]|uniref:Uncharacterized protein n=1 Tax=Paraburkholderia caffeinitolerans TaxID=1723730 RepID=A0A6J5H3Q1_9BURK|nr:hypothetical protein [Paraburkholderia caffeinitolerans]CAB3808413.1 hypothetical protein LMG28688_06758 [Paraburkholderia caffeinitolerans]